MKKIRLTQKKFALVDDQDFEELSQYKWCAQKHCNTYYALRNVIENGVKTTIKMHRQILDLNDPDVKVDHKNHNGLDNQRENLRLCTTKQNLRNHTKPKKSTSIYKGVYFNKKIGKFKAAISIYLGSFDDEAEAARAYDVAAKKHYGEFASLNFPPILDSGIANLKQNQVVGGPPLNRTEFSSSSGMR